MILNPHVRSLAPYTSFALLMAAIIAVGLGHSRADQSKDSAGARKYEEGGNLFRARCGYCHLAGGTGTIMLARRLGKDRALLAERTDLTVDYVRKITRTGINGMPPHTRIEVPDSELDLIAAYIARPAAARAAPAPQPPPPGPGHE